MRTMPGHKVADAMLLGNWAVAVQGNCCQSLEEARIPVDATGSTCFPALTKAMTCLEEQEHLAHSSPVLMASAMAFTT